MTTDPKQQSIERQSSIARAIELTACRKNIQLNQIFTIAERISEYVQNGYTPELKKKILQIDEYMNEHNPNV